MAAEENSGMEDDAPGPRGRMAGLLPMIGAGVAGLLVLILIGGEIYAVVKTRALQSELTTVRKELKERGRVAGEQQAQWVALSQQVEAMKTDMAAMAAKAAENAAKEEAAKAAVEAKAAETSAKPVAGATKPAAPKASTAVDKQPVAARSEPPGNDPTKVEAPKSEAAKAAAAKAKAAEAFSCDLAGKSPEEQAKILKRCVSVMDTPPPPPAGKR